jgi:hypothetical protein
MKKNKCCDNSGCHKSKQMKISTPYPKKRNWFERFLDRYNHIMEFIRTILAILTVTLQLIILYRLSN